MPHFSPVSAIFPSITAPITADAATTKVLGINKKFTKTATKVSGLSKAEKKIVKVTVNKSKKKVTVKGLKVGKATFKIGSKSYTVKVGAVAIKKKSFATTLTEGTDKKVTVTSSYGAKDTLAWSSSDKTVVKVKLASTKATAKKVATNRLYALKAGTATITVKSKTTGKKLAVKVKVNAAPTVTPEETPTATTTATPDVTTGSATEAPTATPDAATGSATEAPTATPDATTGSATEAPTATPDVTSGAATATPDVTSGSATSTPDVTTGSATEAPTATPEATPVATPEVVTGGTITVTGAAVSGASVKVISGTTVVAEGTATEAGATFEDVEAGTYVIKIAKDGYDEFTTTAVVEDNGVTTISAVLVETPATASVKSVTSDNLRTFTINFSDAVKADTITNTTLKIYLGNSTTPLTVDTDYELVQSTDKKSVKVVVTAGSYAQQTAYKVVADGLKTVDAVDVDAYTGTITLSDVTAPEVTNVEFTSKKTLKVTFSEPVNVDTTTTVAARDELKIAGEKVLATITDVNAKENTVTYELDSAIATGSYDITVAGVADFAGWKSAEKTLSASYTVKTEAPSIVAASASQKNLVHVTFSAPIQATGTVTIGTATANLADDLVATASEALAGVGDSTMKAVKVSDTQYDFYLHGDNYLSVAAIIEQSIRYNGLKDYDENTVATAQTFKFQADNDSVLPTITAAVVSKKTLSLTFSETVNTSDAENVTNYTFTNEDGKTFNPVAATYDAETNKVALTFSATNVTDAGGTFTLSVKNIKDFSVRDNQMAEYTTSVTFADTKAPSISGDILAKAGTTTKDAQIVITFDKVMDKASIEDLSNYIYYDQSATTSTSLSNWNVSGKTATAVASTDGKSVTITLGGWNGETETVNIDDENDKITILAVKDAVGNVFTDITTQNGLTAFQTTVDQNVIDTIEATGKRTLLVKLIDGASVFDTVDAGDFKFKLDSTAVENVIAVKAVKAADGKSVTLTLNKDINADATITDSEDKTITVYTDEEANVTTSNVAGQKLVIAEANAKAVADKIAPSVVSVKRGADAENKDKIVVTFDEAVNATGANVANDLVITVDGEELDFTEGDFSVADATNETTITITIAKTGIKSNNVTVTLSNGRYIKDAATPANKANAFASTAVEFEAGEYLETAASE